MGKQLSDQRKMHREAISMPTKTKTRLWPWLASPVALGGNLPFLLTRGEYLVGRGAGCQILIRDVSVSRRHARIVVGRWRFEIEDLGSSNGTRIDGRLTKSAQFNEESDIRLGAVRLCLIRAKTKDDVKALFRDEDTYRQKNPRMPIVDLRGFDVTPAQRKIMRLLVTGKSEYEISRILGRSQTTVHNHVQAIYRRVGVHSKPNLLCKLLGGTEQIDGKQRVPAR